MGFTIDFIKRLIQRLFKICFLLFSNSNLLMTPKPSYIYFNNQLPQIICKVAQPPRVDTMYPSSTYVGA